MEEDAVARLFENIFRKSEVFGFICCSDQEKMSTQVQYLYWLSMKINSVCVYPLTKIKKSLRNFRSQFVHSKNICPMMHQKEALICWLQIFVLSCTIIIGELRQKMVKSSDKSTKIWCSLGRIFVASKSVLLFGAT